MLFMFEPYFKCKKNGIPILSDAEIDDHAEEFIKDYDKTLLTNPRAVDIEHFAEYYLGLQQEYNYLSHCGLILGRMVFNDTDRIPVYDVEAKRAEYTSADRGTILLDNTLLEENNEYRLRSTVGHECGHWIYHPGYFYVDPYQMTLFQDETKISTGCRTTDIEGGKRNLVTPTDWVEHHAKYFSAAILMPKTAFLKVAKNPATREYIRDYCNGYREDDFLASHVASIFNVSPASAKIRIMQLGVSMEEEYKRLQQQSIFYMESSIQVI